MPIEDINTRPYVITKIKDYYGNEQTLVLTVTFGPKPTEAKLQKPQERFDISAICSGGAVQTYQ